MVSIFLISSIFCSDYVSFCNWNLKYYDLSLDIYLTLQVNLIDKLFLIKKLTLEHFVSNEYSIKNFLPPNISLFHPTVKGEIMFSFIKKCQFNSKNLCHVPRTLTTTHIGFQRQLTNLLVAV
jgi:hypothetical protein